MKHYNLIFITTFIDTKNINFFLCSLSNNKYIKLKVILLAQNNLFIDINSYQNEFTSLVVISKPNQFNLSKARNICIDYILTNQIEADFVMFPDDDSSFDECFFMNFKKETQKRCPFVIDVYNENSKNKYIKHFFKPDVKLSLKHYYAAGSTNMIIPYRLFVQIGHFDELMGVGAKYGSGEDADYYIRVVQSGNAFIYNPNLYNFHPKRENKYSDLTRQQLLSRYKNYGIGVAYLCFKHKMYFSSCLLCLKALAGSFISFIKLDFKMANIYLYAFVYRIKAVIEFTKCKK